MGGVVLNLNDSFKTGFSHSFKELSGRHYVRTPNPRNQLPTACPSAGDCFCDHGIPIYIPPPLPSPPSACAHISPHPPAPGIMAMAAGSRPQLHPMTNYLLIFPLTPLLLPPLRIPPWRLRSRSSVSMP